MIKTRTMEVLENYGGQGWANSDEKGKFEIRYEKNGNDLIMVFDSLSKAKEFYDSLDCERFAWDMTGLPELIDGMYIKLTI